MQKDVIVLAISSPKNFEEKARVTLPEVHDHFNAKAIKRAIVIVWMGIIFTPYFY